MNDAVECELAQILLMPENPGNPQVIVLREKGGTRSFLVHIGLFEALAISRQIHEETPPRPMTHDLLLTAIERLGGVLLRIAITDLVEDEDGNGTYYGLLVVGAGGEEIEIDCRPSDAIALAVRGGCPIFVAEHILAHLGGIE